MFNEDEFGHFFGDGECLGHFRWGAQVGAHRNTAVLVGRFDNDRVSQRFGSAQCFGLIPTDTVSGHRQAVAPQHGGRLVLHFREPRAQCRGELAKSAVKQVRFSAKAKQDCLRAHHFLKRDAALRSRCNQARGVGFSRHCRLECGELLVTGLLDPRHFRVGRKAAGEVLKQVSGLDCQLPYWGGAQRQAGDHQRGCGRGNTDAACTLGHRQLRQCEKVIERPQKPPDGIEMI